MNNASMKTLTKQRDQRLCAEDLEVTVANIKKTTAVKIKGNKAALTIGSEAGKMTK